MKPYRLLIVNHAVEMGGAEKVLLRFLDSMDREVLDPALACPHQGPLVDEMRARDIRVHLGYPSERLLDIKRQSLGNNRLHELAYPYDLLLTIIRLARLIKREGYELIFTNSAKADIYGSMAGRMSGRPVVWRLHDIITAEAFNRLNRTLFRISARLFAARILAVSNASAEALIDLGADKNKLIVVYNGIDLALKSMDRKAIRKELGINASIPLAGLVGRLVDWKGPDLFLQAAALVAEEMKQARFVLVGDAIFGEKSYAEDLRSLAARLGIADSVVFTGFRDDVPDIMASLDVLVHASILPDPLPTVLIEAMSLSKPVIASNDGGVPEIVEDGVTGLLVPPGDVKALAAAMLRLLGDRKEALHMGKMGRKRAEEIFDIEKTAVELQDRLLECLR
jgi:glycosyltransferase involved in cell wall biosynthesis